MTVFQGIRLAVDTVLTLLLIVVIALSLFTRESTGNSCRIMESGGRRFVVAEHNGQVTIEEVIPIAHDPQRRTGNPIGSPLTSPSP